jgi:hypothetical protein
MVPRGAFSDPGAGGAFGELPAVTPGMRGISVLKRSLLGWSDMAISYAPYSTARLGDAATELREGVSNKGGGLPDGYGVGRQDWPSAMARDTRPIATGTGQKDGKPSRYLKGA